VAIVSVTIAGNAAPLRNALNESEGALAKFGGVAKGFAAAGAAAFVALGAAAGVALKGAIEVEAQQNRLRQILKTTGAATDAQVDSLLKQAEALEKVGVASASNITVAQSQLATFDLQFETIQRLTPAIADYVIAEKGATATSEDFKGMTNALAQALQGNFGALTKSGFVLDETTKEMIKNGTEAERSAALVEVLGSTYEGFNAAARETAQGQLIALQNAFGAVRDEIGLALLPVFKGLVDVLQNVFLPLLSRAVEFFSGPFANSVGDMGQRIIPAFQAGLELIGDVIQNKIVPIVKDFLIPTIQRFAELFLEYVVPAIRTIAIPIFEGLGRIFDIVVRKIRENRDTINRLIETFQIAWTFIRDKVAPVIAVVLVGAFKVAGIAIGVMIDIAAKVIDVFSGIVRVIARVAGSIIDIMTGLVNGVIDGINVMIRGFNRLPSALRFGVEIAELPNFNPSRSLTSATIGGPSLSDIRNEREGGIPSLTTGGTGGGGGGGGTGGGTGGGGGGGGSSSGGTVGGRALTMAEIAIGTAAADFFSSGLDNPRVRSEGLVVNVNVNGALSTQAEIGDAVIQALRAADSVYGPSGF
jgi:uncharacterized membrane protein YgcG